MTIEEIKDLIQTVANADIDEFEYDTDDYGIRIAKNPQQVVSATISEPQISAAKPVQETMTQTVESQETTPEITGNVVTAPLVGTFYAAATEGGKPFVSVGDTIEKGQVIGIVEAMKLMNEVESDFAGTVEAILVENAEMVEYGQPLIVVS